jgi:hypothetical protein
VVTYVDYVLVSPFFLVSAKNFVLDFFLNVQVVRTDDLHLLQFFTKPARNIHNSIYLFIPDLKRSSYSLGLAQRIRETLHIEV